MTFDEKMKYTDDLIAKIEAMVEEELKNSMCKEKIMGMTQNELESTKRTIEFVTLLTGWVKGVSYELAEIRELVEKNNKLLERSLKSKDE